MHWRKKKVEFSLLWKESLCESYTVIHRLWVRSLTHKGVPVQFKGVLGAPCASCGRFLKSLTTQKVFATSDLWSFRISLSHLVRIIRPVLFLKFSIFIYLDFSLKCDHLEPFKVFHWKEWILRFRMISKSAGYSNANMINNLKDRSVTHRVSQNIWFTVS